ncbi:MAG: DUF748 domain-containing protein [Proteobacteria bacterium]|nr:DUF748 domain-containing protein [Pseudomonadota bacterium]
MDGISRGILSPRRPWLWLIIAVALYALAGFVLAPWLIERQLVDLLAKRLNLTTQVDRIQVNPFTLTLEVESLRITDQAGELSHVGAVDRLYANLETSGLIKFAVVLKQAYIEGLDIHFDRSDQETNTFSVLAQRWQNSAPPDASPPEPVEAEAGGLFPLIIADAQLINGRFNLLDQVVEPIFETALHPIDLKITNVSTLPGESGEQQIRLVGEDGSSLTWQGTLSVDPLGSEGHIVLDGRLPKLLYRYFQNQIPVRLHDGELGLSFDYAFAMRDTAPSVELSAVTVTFSGATMTDPANDHELADLGNLTLKAGSLRWPEQTVRIGDVQFAGVILTPHLDANGELSLNMPPAAEPQPDVDVVPQENTAAEPAPRPWLVTIDNLDLTNWQFSLADERVDGLPLSVEAFELNLKNLSNVPEQATTVSLAATVLDGAFTLNGSLTPLPDQVVDATFKLKGLKLKRLQPYVSKLTNLLIETGDLNVEGALRSQPDERVSLHGDTALTGLDVTDGIENERLLSWQSLKISDIDFALAARTLNISQVALAQPFARIEIEADQTTNVGRVLAAPEVPAVAQAQPTPGNTPDATDSPETKPFKATINKVDISAGSASFTDLSLPLPFAANIHELGGTISTISTSSREPVRVDLEGQVNEYGLLTVTGHGLISDWQKNSALSVNFRNVDMPQTSAYTIKFAGRKIDEGKTDLDLQYTMRDANLTGSNALSVHDLRLGETIEHEGAMNLPLDLAVALLKDSNGTIDLNIPVTGRVDDPQFGIGSAIRQAFSRIILSLVTSPFRLLAGLVDLKGDDLDRVAFKPGSSDLTPPELEKLHKLADALTQRPALSLLVTASSAPDIDGPMLQAQAVDARIDSAVQQNNGEASSEQTMRIIERLYLSDGLQPTTAELRGQFNTEDGSTDLTAYVASMKRALVQNEALSAQQFAALRKDRTDNIINAVIEVEPALVARISAADADKKAESGKTNDAGWVETTLHVAAD